MSFKLTLIAATALSLVAAGAALAADEKQAGEPGGMMHHKGAKLESLDIDKDGAISKDEFLAPSIEKFNEIDTDKDGKLSNTEIEARRAAWQEKMKERREKMTDEPPAEAPAAAAPESTAPSTPEAAPAPAGEAPPAH